MITAFIMRIQGLLGIIVLALAPYLVGEFSSLAFVPTEPFPGACNRKAPDFFIAQALALPSAAQRTSVSKGGMHGRLMRWIKTIALDQTKPSLIIRSRTRFPSNRSMDECLKDLIKKQHGWRRKREEIKKSLAGVLAWLGPHLLLRDQFLFDRATFFHLHSTFIHRSKLSFEAQGFTDLSGKSFTPELPWYPHQGETIHVDVRVKQRWFEWHLGRFSQCLLITTDYTIDQAAWLSEEYTIWRPLTVGGLLFKRFPGFVGMVNTRIPFIGFSQFRSLEALSPFIRNKIHRVLYVASGDDFSTVAKVASTLQGVNEVVMEDIANPTPARIITTGDLGAEYTLDPVTRPMRVIRRYQDALKPTLYPEESFDMVIVKGPGQESILIGQRDFLSHVNSRLRPGGLLLYFSPTSKLLGDFFQKLYPYTGSEPGVFYSPETDVKTDKNTFSATRLERSS